MEQLGLFVQFIKYQLFIVISLNMILLQHLFNNWYVVSAAACDDGEMA